MSEAGQPGMWQQFRRRRVTRSAIVYIAVAFVVAEATLLLVSTLGAPDWVGRAVLGGVVLGFPLAVVLAWSYDLTSRGIVKTPDELGPETTGEFRAVASGNKRWLMISVLALVVGVVLHVLRT